MKNTLIIKGVIIMKIYDLFPVLKAGSRIRLKNGKEYLKLANNDKHHTEGMVVDMNTGELLHYSHLPFFLHSYKNLSSNHQRS